jgi:hypothetical protein
MNFKYSMQLNWKGKMYYAYSNTLPFCKQVFHFSSIEKIVISIPVLWLLQQQGPIHYSNIWSHVAHILRIKDWEEATSVCCTPQTL